MGTLQQLRNSILTSVYGRRLGLDANEFLVGPKDHLRPIQSLTSGSSATQVTNYGLTQLDVTTGAASTASSIGTTETGCSWQMAAPVAGVEKILTKVSATAGSTMPCIVELSTGATVTAIDTTLGTTFTGINLQGVGAYVRLLGLGTTSWLVIGKSTGTSLASSN